MNFFGYFWQSIIINVQYFVYADKKGGRTSQKNHLNLLIEKLLLLFVFQWVS